jgi:hypothetical protein
MMNDVMADLASDALNSMVVFYLPQFDGDAGEFGQCGSGASNVVGLTPLSHCIRRSEQLIHFKFKLFTTSFF